MTTTFTLCKEGQLKAQILTMVSSVYHVHGEQTVFQLLNQRQITGDIVLLQILPNCRPSQFVRLVTASHRHLTAPNTMLAKENVLVLCAGCVLMIKVLQKLCGQPIAHPSRTVMITGLEFVPSICICYGYYSCFQTFICKLLYTADTLHWFKKGSSTANIQDDHELTSSFSLGEETVQTNTSLCPAEEKKQDKRQFSRLVEIIFYFYQIAQLLLFPNSLRECFDTQFLKPVLGFFNFQPLFIKQGFLCPFPGLTPETKLVFKFAPVLGTLIAIFSIYGLHSLICLHHISNLVLKQYSLAMQL